MQNASKISTCSCMKKQTIKKNTDYWKNFIKFEINDLSDDFEEDGIWNDDDLKETVNKTIYIWHYASKFKRSCYF